MEPQCTGKVGDDCHDETITKCQDISIKNVINASLSLWKVIHNFRFGDFHFCKVEDSKVNAENTQDTDPKGTNLTKYLISAGKL